MRISRENIRHNKSPEYRQALQELIKYELQALVERLSATGEEALILTASICDGATTQFGSQKAEGFLRNHINLETDFLSYCNDDQAQSSADELCNYEDDINTNSKKDKSLGHVAAGTPPIPYPVHRSPRERSTSHRLSITEQAQDDIYTVSQNSDLSASERNDSASSVLSFVDAQSKDINSLTCKICCRHFRSYKNLNQHVRLHMAKSYKCGVCGKMFSVKKSYQRHLKTHIKENKLFECGFCDKSFTDQYSFKRHREHHIGVRNYSCNLCGKAFYEKYSLRVHQTSHFYSAPKTDKNLDTTSGFSCHICQKLSKTKAALKIHLLTHSAKKHTCEFCNKRFSLRYSYVRHRRIHTGEKPYKCGSCDRSFSDGSAWSKHIRTHSGVKPYSCDVCSKSFFDKSSCKIHMKVHQGKRGSYRQTEEKRNFEIISTKENKVGFKDEKMLPSIKTSQITANKIDFEISDSESRMFDEDLGLGLDNDHKDFENDNSLNSGFAADILETEGEKHDLQKHDEDKNEFPNLLDLDEKFQTEFVERNMPLKALESDNEFISTTFPDESDIMADDTETDNQDDLKKPCNEQTDTYNHNKPYKEDSTKKKTKKGAYRRATKGKLILDSPSKCKICRKTFQQESLLKQHLQFHCMLKLYKCRYCGKQLSTQHSLVRHERIHIGDRPYQCYICQKSFPDNYGCIRHIKHHFSMEGKNVTSHSSFSLPTLNPSPSNYNSSTRVKPGFNETEQKQASISTIAYQNKETVAKMSSTLGSKSNTALSIYTDKLFPTSHIPSDNSKHSKLSHSPSRSVQNTGNSTETKNNVNSSSNQSNLIISAPGNTVDTSRTNQLYKCYLCSALFVTEKLCVDHIQQKCSLKSKQVMPRDTETITNDSNSKKLKNIYQCSLCCKMFEDELTCQMHVNQGCVKPVASTECAVQSILQESLQYSDPTETEPGETLPRLPFPEINSNENYLKISDDDVILLSNQYTDCIKESPPQEQSNGNQPNTPHHQASVSAPYLDYSQTSSLQNTQAAPTPTLQFHTSTPTLAKMSSPPDKPFTTLVQKPIMTIGNSTYVVTNQGLSLVGSPTINPSVQPIQAKQKQDKPVKPAKKSESDVSERTCSICNKVFTTKHILKQHTLIHMEKNFGCKYCMKKFHNKYGRDRHERIHTGETPFSCPTCRKAFSDNSTYRKHTRVCCTGK